MANFQHSRLHFDAVEFAELAGEGANLVGGAFDHEVDEAHAFGAGQSEASDDDVGMLRDNPIYAWRRLTVFDAYNDCSYSFFHRRLF